MRPALRWAEFVRRYFSGQDDVIRLLEEFDREIVLAPIDSVRTTSHGLASSNAPKSPGGVSPSKIRHWGRFRSGASSTIAS